MTMTKAYKQLRKKLSKKYEHHHSYLEGYAIGMGARHWIEQSGITYDIKHLDVLCAIHGSVPYPYQKSDRKKILKYLKENKKYEQK